MPYKANEPRRHRIPKARYRIENWAEYDAALRRRGGLTVWVTPEATTAWMPAQIGRRGRPRRYSDIAIEAGLMLRLAFGRPWRQTEGMLGSIMDLLGLELPVPDHTTFSRRSVDLGVATALKKANVHVVIDSTGLKVFGSGGMRSTAASRAGAGASSTWRSIPTAARSWPRN
jgi:Transposase DDE domain